MRESQGSDGRAMPPVWMWMLLVTVCALGADRGARAADGDCVETPESVSQIAAGTYATGGTADGDRILWWEEDPLVWDVALRTFDGDSVGGLPLSNGLGYRSLAAARMTEFQGALWTVVLDESGDPWICRADSAQLTIVASAPAAEIVSGYFQWVSLVVFEDDLYMFNGRGHAAVVPAGDEVGGLWVFDGIAMQFVADASPDGNVHVLYPTVYDAEVYYRTSVRDPDTGYSRSVLRSFDGSSFADHVLPFEPFSAPRVAHGLLYFLGWAPYVHGGAAGSRPMNLWTYDGLSAVQITDLASRNDGARIGVPAALGTNIVFSMSQNLDEVPVTLMCTDGEELLSLTSEDDHYLGPSVSSGATSCTFAFLTRSFDTGFDQALYAVDKADGACRVTPPLAGLGMLVESSGYLYFSATIEGTEGARVWRIPIDCGNAAPDTSEAVASPAVLWPPNNKMVDIEIEGVTDPDGDTVTIVIDSIYQDERVGKDGPDATGLDTPTARVRAQRKGNGDGRVYTIHFTATDAAGNASEGTVQVGVPHNGSGGAAVDGGPLYESTEAS